jgi:hypothetical protein
VKFFTSSWAVERWNLSFVSLVLSLFLKSIRENMILWFLNIRHSGTLFASDEITTRGYRVLTFAMCTTIMTAVLMVTSGLGSSFD